MLLARHLHLCLVLLVTGMIACSTAARANELHIVAEVNGEAISNYEVENRTQLIIATRKLQDTPQIRAQVRNHVINSLVNETIQRQYANDQRIKATAADMKLAKKTLEQQNNVPSGQFEQHLNAAGITKIAMEAQMEAQILWQKIVSREIRSRVQVPEFEVEDALDQFKNATEDQQEYYISEIALPIDSLLPDETEALAKSLVTQLNNGASFGELAEEFSIAPSKKEAGSLGWVTENQIPNNMRDQVKNAKANSLLPPFLDAKTNVYRIIKVGNSRDASANIAAQEKRIRELLTSRAIEKNAQSFMKELRQKSFVEFR